MCPTNGHKSAIAEADFFLLFSRLFFLNDGDKLSVFFDQTTVAMRIFRTKTDDDQIGTIGQSLTCGQK